jgi:hypothetical protein
MFVDARKSSAGQEPCKPKSTAPERTGRTSPPVHLVKKAPKEHLDVHKPVIWGTSAFGNAPDNVTGCICS